MRYWLGCCLLVALRPAVALEFEDYDFSRWSQEITECDRLAAHGRDPGHVGDPVTSETMDKESAIAACSIAVHKDPDNPRLNYQLARAYGYSGRGEEAMPYRMKAVAADYPQSTFVIGYISLLGLNIEQNTCLALELWQRSARYRRLAALVSLPRHYMNGDFESCGVEIPDEDLRDYLLEAKKVSGDYYVNMLVDELLSRLASARSSATRSRSSRPIALESISSGCLRCAS